MQIDYERIFRCWGLVLCASLVGCAESQVQQVRTAPVTAEAMPAPPLGPRIYVANESSNNVSVIDAERFHLIGTIDAKNHATHDLALSRDGKTLFATNLASGRLSVIDTEKMETVASIYTGARSHVVTLTNDNKQAWIANIGEDDISILDINSLKIVGSLPTGKGPTGLAFSRDGHFAYVSNQGDKTVSVIEVNYQRVIKSIPVGTNPHFLILGPDGRIWGCNTGANDIYVIDPNTHEIVGSFQVGAFPQQIAFGYKGLSGPNAYVTVAGFNKVLVLSTDLKRMSVLEEIEVGDRPNGIWANSDGTRVFVANEGSNDIRIIDTGTSQVIGTVPVGRKPIRVVASR